MASRHVIPSHRFGSEIDMRTGSWPILLGVFALVAAAFWYDASNASAQTSLPQTIAQVR